MDIVYDMARKEYIRSLIPEIEQNLKVLSNALRKLHYKPNDVLNKYHMLDSSKLIFSKEELEWMGDKKSQNPYKREYLRYSTNNGIKMRSKSERTIGNFLEANNIPYLYEPEFMMDGKIYYPDFVILRNDGSLLIWEHLGLSDDIEYMQKAFYKLENYRKAGYVQHSNLVCTYENDLLDLETLNSILHRFILRY